MTANRQYRLLCPIARALDILGDRWTLLILRDLHAGPARFLELQQGLGIATNLLSVRLNELIDSGLIERLVDTDSTGYQLTDTGRGTDRVIWELARFGAGLERPADPREAGNLRTIALPLRILLESVDERPQLKAALIVDDAEFTIVSSPEAVTVDWGRTIDDVDIVVRTTYGAFLDVGEGAMDPSDFAANHLTFLDGAEHAAAFLSLLSPIA